MTLRKIVSPAIAACAMMVAMPISSAYAANTSSAARLSLSQTAQSGNGASAAQRAVTPMGQKSEVRGGFIIPLVAVIAIILGILALTGGNSDRPHTP